MEKMILMGSMVVLTSICVISSNDSQAQQRPHRESYKREEYRSENRQELKEREVLRVNDGEFRHVSTNTSINDGDRVTTITVVDEDGRKFRLKKVNRKTESLSIDGEEIDEDDFDEYRAVISNMERVSAGAAQKAALQRQKSQERRTESEANRELRREGLRQREMEMATQIEKNRDEAERLMHEQEVYHKRNKDKLEREEAFRGKQLREFLEKQSEANKNRNGDNRSNGEYERDFDETSKRKLKETEILEFKEQLHEREMMKKAEQDGNRSRIEQQRLLEKLERAGEIQERNADRISEQKAMQQERYREQIKRNREIQQRNIERIQQHRKAEQDIYRNKPDRQRETLREYHTNSAKPKSYQLVKPRLSINKRGNDNANHEISGIIEVLEEEELIDSPDRVSFTLTDDHLIVNGRRQSSDVHERLRDKYIRKQGDHYSYFKDGNSTRTTIHRN